MEVAGVLRAMSFGAKRAPRAGGQTLDGASPRRHRESVIKGITLHVADVEALLEFYMRIPGAELAVHRPGQFALLRIGSGRLGLLKHETPGFHVEFDCDNLDAAYEQLRAVGLATKGPPTRKPWGERDLLLLDPDGHTLEFDEAEEARGQLWLQDQTERPSDASADTTAPA